MSTTDRIKTHLLRRLNRRALRTTFAQACAAGLLHPEEVAVHGISLRRYREGSSSERVVGPAFRNEDTVRRLLSRPRQLPEPDRDQIDSFSEEAIRDLLREGIEVQPEDLSNASGEHTPHTSARSPVDGAPKPVPQQLLDVLRSLRAPLPAAEVAVCLLLASAFRSPGLTFEKAMTTLASPTPMICVRASIHDFEAVFTSMAETGTLLPKAVSLQDGINLYSRDLLEHVDSSKVLTLKLTQLESVGRERGRHALAKARRCGAPILVMTELGIRLPGRIAAGADLILDTPMLDVRMLAEIIAICCCFSIEQVIAAIQSRSIPILHLGLDDLSLAIRAERTLPDILTRLEALGRENRKADGDDNEEEVSENSAATKKETQESRSSTNSSAKSQSRERSRSDKSSKHNIDIIEPEPSSKRRTRQKKSALHVETLSGYGEARPWALDLKADLQLWSKKKLSWSDMSVKLLLSGPPGTGKTTFAKALCNSLQIPLIATSVADWLEPGYLGDVLRRMAAVFEVAQARQPVIMLIDEIDGIGRRDAGGGRYYDDYWVSVINRLLELLDGAAKTEGVIIIGATNRPDAIDPALRRSGRLETHIPIQLPDLDALEGIFAHHLGPDFKRLMATAAQAKALSAHPQEPAHG